MALKENYKDAIFIENKKYRVINNTDGSISFIDVTEYLEEGDEFGATDVNGITTKINELDNEYDDLKNVKEELEQLKNTFYPTLLYINENGTSEAFDLTESAGNFESLEWFFRDNDKNLYSIRSYNNYATTFTVSFIGIMSTESSAYLKNLIKKVDGTKVTGKIWSEFQISTNETTKNEGKNIFITKVIGYNKKKEGEVVESNS